uniref:Actin-related protein 5 n=1 Tax=Heterorhabditis bacteriophora TaxID=37862 RepID=A0A1I7WUF4_HETBA
MARRRRVYTELHIYNYYGGSKPKQPYSRYQPNITNVFGFHEDIKKGVADGLLSAYLLDTRKRTETTEQLLVDDTHTILRIR